MTENQTPEPVLTPARPLEELYQELSPEELMHAFQRLQAALKVGPQEELKFRIQCNIDGEDPGPAYNTGADGWRVR